jgi:hypothetical protein
VVTSPYARVEDRAEEWWLPDQSRGRGQERIVLVTRCRGRGQGTIAVVTSSDAGVEDREE